MMWRAGVNAKVKDASSERDGQIRSSPLVRLSMSNKIVQLRQHCYLQTLTLCSLFVKQGWM
jgi:hypothetical protein